MKNRLRPGIWPVVLAALLVMDTVFLWRDYHHTRALYAAQIHIDDMRMRVRSMMAEDLFGSPFIPNFELTDLTGQSVPLPRPIGEYRLLVFFSPSDCNACLLGISGLNKREWGDVSVMGVAGIGQGATLEQVKHAVEGYGYRFPVYAATDLPPTLVDTPYLVLIDRQRNVLYLEQVHPGSIPQMVAEIQSLFDRHRI